MREDGIRSHMDKGSRTIIEEGLERGDSARRIAREAGPSPSTVTREAMRNRTVTERKRMPGANLSVRRAQGRPHEGGRHLPRREERAHAGDRQTQVRRRERVGVAPLPGRVAAARVAVPDGGPPTYCKVRKKLNVTSRNRYGLLSHHLLHPWALATPRKGKPSSHRIRYPRTTVWRSSTPLPIG